MFMLVFVIFPLQFGYFLGIDIFHPRYIKTFRTASSGNLVKSTIARNELVALTIFVQSNTAAHVGFGQQKVFGLFTSQFLAN
jgi:hypothetical protein